MLSTIKYPSLKQRALIRGPCFLTSSLFSSPCSTSIRHQSQRICQVPGFRFRCDRGGIKRCRELHISEIKYLTFCVDWNGRLPRCAVKVHRTNSRNRILYGAECGILSTRSGNYGAGSSFIYSAGPFPFSNEDLVDADCSPSSFPRIPGNAVPSIPD